MDSHLPGEKSRQRDSKEFSWQRNEELSSDFYKKSKKICRIGDSSILYGDKIRGTVSPLIIFKRASADSPHLSLKNTMAASHKRSSLLCPNCKRLVGRTVPECPSCGLKNPGSMWKDNIFTRGTDGKDGIIRVILIANIVMFALSVIIDFRSLGFSSNPFSFLSPSNDSLFVLGSTGTIPLLKYGNWWSLISASFLHGSLLHIAFNMIALHQLGPLIIREYGVYRMISIYSLSGVGGYIISTLFGVPFTIGASAAVCGLVGAALYYGKSRGGAYGNAVYSQIGGWALSIFIFGFLVPGINNFGHGGGMLVGVLTGYILGYRERSKETIIHSYISMACIVCTGLVLSWSVIRGILFFLYS